MRHFPVLPFVALGLVVACSSGLERGDPGELGGGGAAQTGRGEAGTASRSHAGSGGKSSSVPSGASSGGITGRGGQDGGSGKDAGGSTPDAGTGRGSLGAALANLALANLGLEACSTNTAGGTAYETSCTGNGGSPEYWCADFVQWVWAQEGVDTAGLNAAASSFYTYGENHGTLHQTPSVGDAVVFYYPGTDTVQHVAIVTQVNADGTIETVSGDWGGSGATEAAFSSTSKVVLNKPAYNATVGTTPAVMNQTIAGFVSPALSSDPAAGCYSSTLSAEMPSNACVQSASDSNWYQCDDGVWVDRWTDATACNGTYPLN